MAQRSHTSMTHLPSHGNASQAKVGNGQLPSREGYRSMAPGQAGGGRVMEASCMFAAPPPKRNYCHPAAFTSLDGRSHHRILDAYGHSRPASGYQ